MPFPLLAHQAPILPLKLWRPRAFSAVALCAGSMAPDVDVALRLDHAHIGHTLLGQLVFCLPLTLAATVATVRYVIPAVAPRLEGAIDPLSSPRAFAIVVASALIGSFSHIGLDALTHEGPLGGLRAQLGFSVVGALAAVPMLAAIARASRTAESVVARPVARGRWLLIVLPLACAIAAAVLSRDVVKHATYYFQLGHLYVWGYVAFRVFCAGFVGLTVAAAVLPGTRVAA